MGMTRWFKCDLQVATPAWEFTMPNESCYDFDKVEDRRAFAVEYLNKCEQAGLDIIALADHNSHEWIDIFLGVAADHNVVVFPGCEITTGTGADGAHLLILSDSNTSGEDFNRLLSGPIGFNEGHPRFREEDGRNVPGGSSKTALQILNDLPPRYVAIAPHVLGDNGIASKKTAKGEIRYRVLHHPKLLACEVGASDGGAEDGFQNMFRERALDHFPCLKRIAFVATSDSYSLDSIGSKYTWIRMSEPTIEGLRQALLDYETRIIRDSDSSLDLYIQSNPNRVRHSWIKSISISGASNITDDVQVHFHSGLNVLIGGRGSGKSTIIEGLRTIYGNDDEAPASIIENIQQFRQGVFSSAQINASHIAPLEADAENAEWSHKLDSRVSGAETPVAFQARVVSQKELFAIVAEESETKSTSQNLLRLIDRELRRSGRLESDDEGSDRSIEEARETIRRTIHDLRDIQSATADLPTEKSVVSRVEGQLEEFDEGSATNRRQRLVRFEQRYDHIIEFRDRILEWITLLEVAEQPTKPEIEDGDDELDKVLLGLEQHVIQFQSIVESSGNEVRALLEKALSEVQESEWYGELIELRDAESEYIEELKDKGFSVEDYETLTEELTSAKKKVKLLEEKISEEYYLQERLTDDYATITLMHDIRRQKRKALLDEIETSSNYLRFNLVPHRDMQSWVTKFRQIAGIRSDGYVDEVPTLAKWIFVDDIEEDDVDRIDSWRNALISGDLAMLEKCEPLRASFIERISGLDPSIRWQIASLLPADRVSMQFLPEGADRENPDTWRDVGTASPGERSAAMLSFVLSHGNDPLILDQPEDDLDTSLITEIVVRALRKDRIRRQIIVATHNANIPVNGDAERIIVMENKAGKIGIKKSGSDLHCGAIEEPNIRRDIQDVMEGGVEAFVKREERYNAEVKILKETQRGI